MKITIPGDEFNKMYEHALAVRPEEDKRLANDSRASYLILSLEVEGKPVLNAFHVEGNIESRTVRKEELEISS